MRPQRRCTQEADGCGRCTQEADGCGGCTQEADGCGGCNFSRYTSTHLKVLQLLGRQGGKGSRSLLGLSQLGPQLRHLLAQGKDRGLLCKHGMGGCVIMGMRVGTYGQILGHACMCASVQVCMCRGS